MGEVKDFSVPFKSNFAENVDPSKLMKLLKTGLVLEQTSRMLSGTNRLQF